MITESWKSDANCRGEDPRRFLDDFESATLTQRLNTIRMCIDCPAFDACREYAETHNSWGIHAGKFYRDGVAKDPLRIQKTRATILA